MGQNEKIVCVLLACCLISSQVTSTYANSQILRTSENTKTETIKDSLQMNCPLVNISKEPLNKKELSQNNSSQLVLPNELIEKISDEADTHNSDDAAPKLSKLQMAKNMAIYLAKSFASDIKSYIKYYPLTKVSYYIVFCCCFLLTYLLYKATGIDIPAKTSCFRVEHENLAMICENLYNVIPMIITSFLYKYGQKLCGDIKGYLFT